MKKVLNEEGLKEMVKTMVLQTLEESYIMNKIQDRRSTQANNQMKLKSLRELLWSVGIDKITEKNVHGDVGYMFTIPMDKAVSAAKQLKSEGVAFKTLRQDGHYQDGEIWDATMFAYFGRHQMMEGKVKKTK